MGLVGITVLPATAGPIWDMCNLSKDSEGNSCPNPDDYLTRLKFADGTCSDWICCTKNVLTPEQLAQTGQTYDCTSPTSPTRIRAAIINKALQGGLVLTSTKPPSTTTIRTTTSGTLAR